jgi:hypothetical protein
MKPIQSISIVVSWHRMERSFLPTTDSLPQVVRDDPEIGSFLDDQLRLVDCSGYPLAGGRVLSVLRPPPNQAPDVEFIVQKSGATLTLPPDRRIFPWPTTWARNALTVQGRRKFTRPNPSRIVPEDSPNRLGLDFLNHPITIW